MKTTRNPLLLAFAIVGICAILYGAWHMYQQHAADSEARARFAAPVSSGVPDLLQAAPAASPLPP